MPQVVLAALVAALVWVSGLGLGVRAQDGPLTNAANLAVRTDANGYVLAAAQTYSGPDGPLQVFANTLVRTDANGYLIITNPSGFGGGGAPDDAQYWVAAADGDLSAEVDLSALATGLVLNTSGTPSAYGGASCTNQFLRALNAAGAGTCATVSLTADVTGTLAVGNGGTGITSLGTGVATWLGTPSSANFAAAVTGETGTGAVVFATSPTLVTPALGTPASGTLTNATGLPLVAGTTGTLTVARGGTGATTLTDGGLLLGSGTGAITALGVAANGQIPIGDGTTDPVLATLTATANETTVDNGAGTITIGLPDDVTIGSDLIVTDLLQVSGSGGHRYGGVATTSAILAFGGAHSNTSGTSLEGIRLGPDLTAINGTTNRIALLTAGANAGSTIITQGAGNTILDVASAIFYDPAITNSGDTITRASTLKLHSAPTEGTTNAYLSVGTTGLVFAIKADEHVGVGTTEPSVSSCGTSPSIAGNDVAWKVTHGSDAETCTVTFASTWAAAPYCVLTETNAAVSPLGITSITTTAIALTLSNAGVGVIYGICLEPL